jgi:hypothetical protein
MHNNKKLDFFKRDVCNHPSKQCTLWAIYRWAPNLYEYVASDGGDPFTQLHSRFLLVRVWEWTSMSF